MSFGLIAAMLAAICTGTAALLQAIGVRRIRSFSGVDPRLLWSLVRSAPYVAGLTCNGASFALSLFALRSVPLFVVQAIVASNLAVVAVLATWVLGARLRLREWSAVAGVVGGVVLLTVSATPSQADHIAWTAHWAMLGVTVVLGFVAFVLGRWLRAAGLMGLLAGLSFGMHAFSARVLGSVVTGSVVTGAGWQLAVDPAVYALVLGGSLGTLLYATALQRGSVTTVSAMAIVGQTLAPAVGGWLLLGGQAHSTLIAALGFFVTVAGAIGLARHAHPESLVKYRERSLVAGGVEY